MTDWLERLKRVIWSRQYAYKQAFAGVHGKVVLKDLARFCRANESTFDENERRHVLADGRREVFLHIARHLKLDADALWAYYTMPEQETD